MIILGLTGSIGMGKSTAAATLRRFGARVHDADLAVRRLQGPGGAALPAVARLAPGTVAPGTDGQPTLDRAALRAAVQAEPGLLRRLEALLHPLVARDTQRFLATCARLGVRVAVLDVPLLLEGGGWRRCDRLWVVSAPARLQRWRVLRRPGMTRAWLEGILARQMPDRQKRRLADATVPTGLGRAHTHRILRRLWVGLYQIKGAHWPPPPWTPPSLRRRPRLTPTHARNRLRH